MPKVVAAVVGPLPNHLGFIPNFLFTRNSHSRRSHLVKKNRHQKIEPQVAPYRKFTSSPKPRCLLLKLLHPKV